MKRKSSLFFLLLICASANAQILKGDMDGDGRLTMSDANDVVNTYLGAKKQQYINVNAASAYSVDNSIIVGKWFKNRMESITFNEDGTTDYAPNCTYKFLPYQGKVLFLNKEGVPVDYLTVWDVTENGLVLGNGTMTNYTNVQPEPNTVFTVSLPTGACSSFDLYRLLDSGETVTTRAMELTGNKSWKTGYTVAGRYDMVTTMAGQPNTIVSENGGWVAPWKVKDDNTFYHYRTVSAKTPIIADATNGDYFTIQAGPLDATSDCHWGAPGVSTSADYNPEDGFASSLFGAIGVSDTPISIIERNMMATVNVVLMTTDDYSGVTLQSNGVGSEVEFVGIYNRGKVNMGDGLVSVIGTKGNIKMPMPNPYFDSSEYKSKPYTYNFVPQILDDNMQLRILCEGNYYMMKMSNLNIKQWYPGHTYTYYITITKTMIRVEVKDTITVNGPIRDLIWE